MKRKVIQVEEKAANLLMSSQQTKQERDELKKKLQKAESTEHYSSHMTVLTPSPQTVSNSSSTENVSS